MATRSSGRHLSMNRSFPRLHLWFISGNMGGGGDCSSMHLCIRCVTWLIIIKCSTSNRFLSHKTASECTELSAAEATVWHFKGLIYFLVNNSGFWAGEAVPHASIDKLDASHATPNRWFFIQSPFKRDTRTTRYYWLEINLTFDVAVCSISIALRGMCQISFSNMSFKS